MPSTCRLVAPASMRCAYLTLAFLRLSHRVLSGHLAGRPSRAEARHPSRKWSPGPEPRSRSPACSGLSKRSAPGSNIAMATFTIRPIEASDDVAVAALIREVMPEFGACGPGFAIEDPEVDGMAAAYGADRAGFFVLERDGKIVGGAGYAQLTGAAPTVCELRKMYFYPEARGHGQGQRLLSHVLAAARTDGFETCYLETLEAMSKAAKLYRANGFEPLEAPMGATGHFGCNRYMAKRL